MKLVRFAPVPPPHLADQTPHLHHAVCPHPHTRAHARTRATNLLPPDMRFLGCVVPCVWRPRYTEAEQVYRDSHTVRQRSAQNRTLPLTQHTCSAHLLCGTPALPQHTCFAHLLWAHYLHFHGPPRHRGDRDANAHPTTSLSPPTLRPPHTHTHTRARARTHTRPCTIPRAPPCHLAAGCTAPTTSTPSCRPRTSRLR